ncbi:MAG: hypothetical protein K2G24_01095 [Muribaculaceae bacterium]|nr:hypothetical protein [Muribaculaceae bacterium]
MKSKLLSAIFIAGMSAACSVQPDVTVNVTNKVINPAYIGNGVEWDPYDEAGAWGAPLSDSDWQKLFDRLDYMRPAYVRCMINSPFRYFDSESGEYCPDRNSESIERLLGYCQKNNIMVVYGEYNPPTWNMKQDQRWVDMSVAYLNRLVTEKGFSCIRHFVIFNEPDGDWASTDGDFDMWLSMAGRFHAKMAEYPGLLDNVSLAGPDVVAEYHNRNSKYDTAGWLEQTVSRADSLIGLYDIHAYPGQAEVRSGAYRKLLQGYRHIVPQNKQVILGEAGYKYWREADSLLMAEYNHRAEGHPFTNGSDCNMLVYDKFYGLDMALLVSEVMNSGFSGVAAWMLDDAMHSQGDSGKPEDIKLWGMWNILGEEVFGDASQEDVRPWYYTWSLMCRCFPAGCDVTRSSSDCNDIFTVSAIDAEGRMSVAVINVGADSHQVALNLPRALKNAALFSYSEADGIALGPDGLPAAVINNICDNALRIPMDAYSMIILTEIDF